ncbi:hypothetical protein [Morganella psychrotolerans]|uniref:hypothetical protein n=1 Tax=Morganella psychrotolerans TaxID=368603 RepID=UPI0012E8D356|nr:hypothetical protein [Morganella psychrotolerans]
MANVAEEIGGSVLIKRSHEYLCDGFYLPDISTPCNGDFAKGTNTLSLCQQPAILHRHNSGFAAAFGVNFEMFHSLTHKKDRWAVYSYFSAI